VFDRQSFFAGAEVLYKISAKTKREVLQGPVKAVYLMGTWGKWFEVLSMHPGDLEGLLRVGGLNINIL
jgi:hypothetical protein